MALQVFLKMAELLLENLFLCLREAVEAAFTLSDHLRTVDSRYGDAAVVCAESVER